MWFAKSSGDHRRLRGFPARRTIPPQYRGRPAGVLVCLVLLLVVAGSFHVALRRDETVGATYAQAVEAVRASQMLASQWSVELEAVRRDADSDFDGLVDMTGQMSRQIQIIRDARELIPDLPDAVKWAMNGYIQRLQTRKERIDRFKSDFTIARNSRRFIPKAGGELAEAARDGGYGKVEVATRQTLGAVRGFLRQPSRVQRRRAERAAGTLAANARGTALHTQADHLNMHVHALLQHYGATERWFWEVMRSDLEGRAEQVIGLLDAEHRLSRTKQRYYHYGLWLVLGFAALCWSILIMRWMRGGAPQADNRRMA